MAMLPREHGFICDRKSNGSLDARIYFTFQTEHINLSCADSVHSHSSCQGNGMILEATSILTSANMTGDILDSSLTNRNVTETNRDFMIDV